MCLNSKKLLLTPLIPLLTSLLAEKHNVNLMAAFLVPNEIVSLPPGSLTLDEEDRKRNKLIAKVFKNDHAKDFINIRRKLLESIQMAVFFTRKSPEKPGLTLDTQRHQWTELELFAFWTTYVMSECVSEGDQARDQRAEGFKEIFNDVQMQSSDDPKGFLCEFLNRVDFLRFHDLSHREDETLYDFIRRTIQVDVPGPASLIEE